MERVPGFTVEISPVWVTSLMYRHVAKIVDFGSTVARGWLKRVSQRA